MMNRMRRVCPQEAREDRRVCPQVSIAATMEDWGLVPRLNIPKNSE